jgi:hypothetical protein
MVSRNVYVEFQKGTPHSFLENYIHYGSNIVAVKKVACSYLLLFEEKKVVGKHMEFVKLQLMQWYRASA